MHLYAAALVPVQKQLDSFHLQRLSGLLSFCLYLDG